MFAKLHEYQKNILFQMIKGRKQALFLDMGLGKTLITLSFIQYLKEHKRDFGKTLVVAPLRVARTTWVDESQKWDNFSNLKTISCCGAAKKRLSQFQKEADIYCINFENCVWMVQNVDLRSFDLLVIDELSAFKSIQPNTIKNKRGQTIRYVGSKRTLAIEQVLHKFKWSIGLTGTPNPNSYLELFPQISLLNKGIFGENFYRFRAKYFQESFYDWELKPGAKEEILDKLKRVAVSLKAEDYLKMPEKIYNDIYITLSPAELKRYKDFKENWFDQDTRITTQNAIIKLVQMASGFIYNEFGVIYKIHDKLMEAVKEIIDHNTNNVLIFCNFRAEIDTLVKLYLGAIELKNEASLKQWNEGNIKVAVSHPASVGHGLNLQGGGNTIIWYGLNWSLELTKQAEARLYRQGQKAKNIIIHRIIVKNTIHEYILQVLKGKLKLHELTIDTLKLL